MKLRGDVRFRDGLATRGTRIGQRHVVGFVDDGGDGTLAATAILGARFATGPPGPSRGRALRKRRRLPGARAPRRLQLVLQPRILSFEPGPLALAARAFRFRSRQFLAQPPILAAQLLDSLARFSIARARHAPVMPDFAKKYKSDPVTSYLFSFSPFFLFLPSLSSLSLARCRSEHIVARSARDGHHGRVLEPPFR